MPWVLCARFNLCPERAPEHFDSKIGRPVGSGIGMNCRKPFNPNTTKMRPSRLRAMRIKVFTVVSGLASVQVKQQDLRRFGRTQFQRAFFADRGGIAATEFFPIERY